jgi:hypothetical protein
MTKEAPNNPLPEAKKKFPSFATIAKVAVVTSLLPLYKLSQGAVQYFSADAKPQVDPDEYKGSCTAINEAATRQYESLAKINTPQVNKVKATLASKAESNPTPINPVIADAKKTELKGPKR